MAAGRHELKLRIGDAAATKTIAVGGKSPARIAPRSVRAGGIDELFHPGEPALPRDSAIVSIEVSLSGRHG